MKVNTMEVDRRFGRFRRQRQESLQVSLVWVFVLGFCFNSHLVYGQEEVEGTVVTIKTPLGNVKGQRLQYKGLRGQTITTVDKFLGIPFAEPPVGKLRFRQPKPHKGWTGTLEAITVPPGCVGKPLLATPPPPPPGDHATVGDEMPEALDSFPPPLSSGGPAPAGFEMPSALGFLPEDDDSSVPPGAGPAEGQLPSPLNVGDAGVGMLNASGAPPALGGSPPGAIPSWLQEAVRSNPPSSRKRRQAPVPELFLPDDVPPVAEVNGTVGEDANSTISGDGHSQEEVISAASGTSTESSNQGSLITAEETTEDTTAMLQENNMVGDLTTLSSIFPEGPSGRGMPPLPPVPSNDTNSIQEGPFGSSRPTQEGPFGPSRPTQEGPFGPSRPTQEGPFGPSRPIQDGPFGPRGGSQEGPFGNRSDIDPFRPGQDLPPGTIPISRGVAGVDYPLNMSDTDNTFKWSGNFNGDGLYALPGAQPGAQPPNLYPRPPPMMHKPPISTETSEDCLFLNVFVPGNKNETSPLPVMVFIHGGGFTAGHALMNDPTNLAMETDSIVVTIAYRLHVYGFFSLPGSQEYPGNLGLWDQVAALQWVQTTIGSFGGDPQRVTLAGHSAGAMSVSMHVASPASSGLFQGAFSMSGAQTNLRSDTPTTQASSGSLLEALRCGGPLDHYCIVNATQASVDAYANSLDFKPILDGQFFPENPLTLVEMNRYNKVPYLFGVNSDEGLSSAIAILDSLGDDAYPNMIGGDFVQRIQGKLGEMYDSKRTRSISILKITDLVHRQYMWQTSHMTEALRQIIDLASDMFMFPIKTTADAIAAKQTEVYLFYFNHTPSATEKLYEDHLLLEVGAGHTEPLNLLFGRTDMQMSSYEQELCEEYLSSLKSFLHTGKPSLPGVGDEMVDWPAYDEKTGNFVDFGWQGSEVTYRMSSGFPSKTVLFWTDVLPAFIEDLEKTCPSVPPPGMFDVQAHTGEIIVRTSNGRVRGVTDVRVTDKQAPPSQGGGDGYQMFLGIQYAAPPTGERRWQDPETPTRWQHIRQALSFPPSCPQPGEGNHNENCLHLNVWVPALQDQTAEKLPVIVYIHGGGFLTGHGNEPSFLDLSFEMNSIVVSVNFRLGALGFLSLGNDEYPGNYAHKDIIMALRWVQENIFTFGGNPCKVSLLGVDSGAVLASQIALSRYANGLITNVITMGGSAKAPWANDFTPIETAKSLARKMACPDEKEPGMIDCLRQKDVMALASVQTLEVTTSVHGYTSPLASYPWRPVVEGIIDWSNPLSWDISVPFLSGVTDHEGYQLFAAVVGNTDNKTRDNFLEFLEEFVSSELQGSKSVYEAIKSAYFPFDVLRDETRFKNASIAFWTDWGYLAPLVESLSSIRAMSFAYRLSYIPDKATQPGLVIHGDDSNMLLFLDRGPVVNMRDKLISLIFNIRLKAFVEYSLPLDSHTDGFWDEYRMDRGFYTINENASVTPYAPLDSLTVARIRIWTDGIPEIMSSLPCPPKGHSSVPNDNKKNDEDQSIHSDTPGPKDNDQLDTGVGADNRSSPNALAVTTTRPGIVDLALFESQLIMLVLGGVCVLFLLVIVILAMVHCSLERRLSNEKNTDTGVYKDDLKYATKI